MMEDKEIMIEPGTEYDVVGDLPSVNQQQLLDNGEEEKEQDVDSDEKIEDDNIVDDLTEPLFEYEMDGRKVQVTGDEIIKLIEQQTTSKEESEVKTEEKSEEQASSEPDLPFEIIQIDYNKVGPDLVAMLNGENGGEAALGPAIAELQFQTFLQDPRYTVVLDKAIEKVLSRREMQRKQEETLKQFTGDVDGDEIARFRKANPWATTNEMAMLGLQLERAKAELAKLQQAKKQEIEQAQKEHEKRILRNLKAKGSLRSISSVHGVKRSDFSDDMSDLKSKYNLSDPDQRAAAMTEYIIALRSKGGA